MCVPVCVCVCVCVCVSVFINVIVCVYVCHVLCGLRQLLYGEGVGVLYESGILCPKVKPELAEYLTQEWIAPWIRMLGPHTTEPRCFTPQGLPRTRSVFGTESRTVFRHRTGSAPRPAGHIAAPETGPLSGTEIGAVFRIHLLKNE